MKNRLTVCSAVAATAMVFAGCWTFNETEYPAVEMKPAGEKSAKLTLGVNGFTAVLTEYEAVSGFTTVYVPGYCGRYHYHPGYVETMPTVSYLPQRRSSDMFLKRAKDEFEKAGYRISTTTPDITINVEFEGPVVTSSDINKDIAWNLLSAFFCDYAATGWTAKLRVHDNRDGRLVFHHDYEQRYETNVFGIIPLFGPAACTSTTSASMQSWCLAALTDRVVADVTEFLGSTASR